MNRAIVLIVGLILAGCGQSGPPIADPPASLKSSGTVTVEIIGAEKTDRIHLTDVLQGTTLEQVMRSINEVPIKVTGTGTTAFVDQIGEQATGGDSGWTFEIDGQHANQGIGATRLSPPTTVTWKFGNATP